MNKNTKMILGVGAVAIVGYLIWKQQSKKSFANLITGRRAPGGPRFPGGGTGAPTKATCYGHCFTTEEAKTGKTIYHCCDGDISYESKNQECGTGGSPKCKQGS